MGFVDALKVNQGSLKPSVGAYNFLDALRDWWTKQKKPPMPTDRLYISGLADLCPRHFVLNYFDPRPTKKEELQYTYAMDAGTYSHYWLQNHILGPVGVLWGNWKNLETNEVVEKSFHPACVEAIERGIIPKAKIQWEYVEQAIIDSEHKFSGRIDGFLCRNRMKFFVNEVKNGIKDHINLIKEIQSLELDLALLDIKSAKNEKYVKINSAADLPDNYKCQISVYCKLFEHKTGLFLYINRDTGDMKFISYDSEEGYWNEAVRKSVIIKNSIRDKVLPDSFMPCNNSSCYRAKRCSHAKECWSKTFDLEKFIRDKENEKNVAP